MNSAMSMIEPKVIRRPLKVIVIDETVSKLVFKCGVWAVKVEDEGSEKSYRIIRTTTKKSLQMIGA